MSSTATDIRFKAIKESGCVCCLLVNRHTTAPDIHHLTAGGRRMGDEFTVGLCPYHHRGLLPEGFDAQKMSGLVGPSFAWGRRTFKEFFCGDKRLLMIQNMILDEFEIRPWFDYRPHYGVRRKAIDMWKS